MPGMTGEELSTELIKIRSDIPIILCSGNSEKLTESATQKPAIKDILMKPLNLDELANAVRKTIDQNQIVL
jgi:FixJ family two-component response regulator